MRRPLVAGNWKMHGTRASVADLLGNLKTILADCQAVDIAVFPPSIFIEQVQTSLQKSQIAWGVQNIATESKGAFTGEIAALMAKEFACQYTLVGHSERRHIYGETNEIVAQKFAIAQTEQLTPILCVGETQQQREQQQTDQVIRKQIQAVLALEQGIAQFEQAVIAYEPVWAIGTGLTATPEQAQQVHTTIRAQLAELDQNIAKKTPILYGGSVKADNAVGLFAMSDIDGALVGGAALDAEQFAKICFAAQ